VNEGLVKMWLLIVLLTLQTHAAADELALTDGVYVDHFELTGNTIFPTDSLLEGIHHYSGSTLFPEDLVDVSRSITDRYVKAGYINSGAILEGLEGNAYRIRIVEGQLTSLSIGSDGRLHPSYVEDAVRRTIKDEPLDIKDLQLAITQLERDPKINYVKGRLLPGANPGDSHLFLDIFEANPLSIRAGSNNYLPPSIGDVQITAKLGHSNLSGRGDSLLVSAAKADGNTNGSIRYVYPFPRSGWEFEIAYVHGDTLVVEKPFEAIDIESDTDVTRVGWRKSLIRTNRTSWSLGFGLEEKTSRSSLFGEPFDFTFGSRNGKTDATVLVLQSEFQFGSQQRAVVLRNVFRRGVGWVFSGDQREADFQVLITQLQYSQRLTVDENNPWLILLRSSFQITGDSLKSFERFPMGGRRSVRGYRENQLLRDNAFELSAELRIPMDALWNRQADLSFSLFTDYGRAWYSQSLTNEDRFQSLSSVGLGLRYRHDRGIAIHLEWAERLSSKEKQGSKLQDDGIHLGISYEM
jgi:hemolysin activation/secretion protein